MTRGAILVAAAALNLTAFAAASHAEPNGTNSAVEDNSRPSSSFAPSGTSCSTRAKSRNIQHSCADGLCDWKWELRPHVWAKMVESNNGTRPSVLLLLGRARYDLGLLRQHPPEVGLEPAASGDTVVAKATTLQATRQRQWWTRTPSRSSPMARAPTSQP